MGILELADCDYNYEANDRELFGLKTETALTQSVGSTAKATLASQALDWSGKLRYGSQCLGIDTLADMGYAVLPQTCEDGKASQYWVGKGGQIHLPSCPDCVEPPPPEGFCWDLYPSSDGNPYFAKGQIMAVACDSGKSTQQFSIHLQDTPPPEAHGKHHIHSNDKCVKVAGDAVSGFILELADCDYNYEANDRELFGLKTETALTQSVGLTTKATLESQELDWSGKLRYGSQCLGIDTLADMGYAVLPQTCEDGKASQYWVGKDGQVHLPSCPDCVEPPPAEGFCWDLYPAIDGNPYFAEGQIMAVACDSGKSTQQLSIHLQDTPPPEAHRKHL